VLHSKLSNDLGLAVFIALLVHAFSDGLNTVSFMIKSGLWGKKSIGLLGVDALARVSGAALGSTLVLSNNLIALYLAAFSGIVIYLATSHILPEAHSRHSSRLTMVATISGVLIMWALVAYLHSGDAHAHGSGQEIMRMSTATTKAYMKRVMLKKVILKKVMEMGTSTQTMNKSDIKLIAVLERTGGFASAQELHQILRREGDGIGLTTVYRALQSLVDDKIVDLLRREDGEAIYRLCGDTHHHHLVCKSCGDTVEIEGGAIEKWAKTMAEEFGFRDVGHTAEIFGICSKC
jgi:Fur family transcriptional regulator, ferric uptake regulator